MQVELDEIIDTIKSIKFDIKPEVVVAELIQSGMPQNAICVKNEGVFRRSYRKEITNARLMDHNDYHDMIEISISRDGLYDLLPEGLFHQSQKGSSKSVSAMVLEHKRFAEEEKDARKFFQPLENEFFFQKVNIEMVEKRFFETINKKKDIHLAEFWKLDQSLPINPMQKMVELMPRSKFICGNPQLMQESLSLILDEKVELQIGLKSDVLNAQNVEDADNIILGLNSVLGECYTDDVMQYVFEIGPLINTSIGDYLPNQPMDKILRTFYDCFTPMEPEIITTFVTDNNDTSRNKDVFLGLNLQL